jgi:hypothetical protein
MHRMLRDIGRDDHGVVRFLKKPVTQREELIDRLALRGLCPRFRHDWHFRRRIRELMQCILHDEVSVVLAEAAARKAELSRQ